MSLEQRVTEAITRATERTPAPAFDLAGIRHGVRRRVRWRAAVGAVALTAAVTVAAGIAATQLPAHDGSVPPVDQPSSTPSSSTSISPTTVADVREKQVVVTWDQPPSPPSVSTLLGRRTSDDPEYAGNGEVSVEAPVYGYMRSDDFGWERYCYGAPGTWWVFTVEPRASYFDFGRCDGSGQASSAPAPGTFDGPLVGEPRDMSGGITTVKTRMFLTNDDPTAYYDCVAYSPPEGCTNVEPPHALGTGARFGVAVYGREPIAPATTIFGSEVYPAAKVSGTAYSFTTAVAAPSGSTLLTYRLPPSTHERIVQAMAGQAEPCRHTDSQRTPSCLPVPQLRVDGHRVGNQGDFLVTTLAAQAHLAPGGAREITLEIPATDTDELDLGFVVFEARDD